jgi:DNA-binding PadR family transcriptional regulator
VPNRPSVNETAASILGFLSLGPMTGWDVNAFAQISVANFWNVTRSQVYRELKVLEEGGLLRGEDVGQRSKRRFHLTDAGRAALADWLRSPPGPALSRNPFLVKLFFATDLSDDEVATLIARARAVHEADLIRYEEVLGAAESLSSFAAATVHYGIAVERAALAWFDAEPWAATPDD